jgi:hypothetical protein
MTQGIRIQYSVSYVHLQNDLTKSLIKRIKLITRPLLQGCNLLISYWGHAVLHAADLVQLVQLHTIPPPYSIWYVEIKHLPFANLYEPSRENGDLRGISIPVHSKIPRALNM